MDLLDELLAGHVSQYGANEWLMDFPCMSLWERARLPETPAIYFALSGADTVLYIGMTTNLRTRWRGHHRIPELERNHELVWIHYLPVDDKYTVEDLRALEAWLIGRFSPRYNNAPMVNPWQQRFTMVYRALRERERAYEQLRRRVAA